MSVGDASKRAARITEARLVLKRAERYLQVYPYQSPQRDLIKDMKMVVNDLLAEVMPS